MALKFWHGERWKLATFARASIGADVYLCCPGPSLADVDPATLMVPGAVVVAVNSAYPHIAKPDFWIGTDHPACFDKSLMWTGFPKVLRSAWQEQTIFGQPIKRCPQTYFADVVTDKHPLDMFHHLSDNLHLFAPAYNSFEAALHFCLWLGAKRIRLVGCDFGGEKDYHDGRVLTEQQRAVNRLLYGHQVQRLAHHVLEGMFRGVEIRSCTPDSPASAYGAGYIPLADALAETQGRVPQGWTPQPHARDAALCRWRGKVTQKRGVVVGVIPEQVWMLEWWLANFRKHNPDLPVAFADFGLNEKWAGWCKEHGLHFKPEAPQGVGAWFRKPFALLQAPFEHVIWLDLDCEVRAPMDHFFAHLEAGKLILAGRGVMSVPYGTAQDHGWFMMMPRGEADAVNAVVACTGFVGASRGNPIIEEWALAHVPPTEFNYRGDHESLAVVASRRQPPRHALTADEFTLIRYPGSETPGIMHWAGLWGKETLRIRMEDRPPVRGHVDEREYMCICDAVRKVAAGQQQVHVLEIGVAEGHTGHAMVRAALDVAGTCTYVGVDAGAWKERAEPPDLPGAEWHFIEAKSQEARDAVAAIARHFDVVLIDGCHCPACVKADRDLYAPMVRPGGTLMFHDTKHTMDPNARQPGTDHRGFGVRAVMEQTACSRGWSMRGESGRFGLAVLRREPARPTAIPAVA